MFEKISDERAALKEFMCLVNTLEKNGFKVSRKEVRELLALYKKSYESSYQYGRRNLGNNTGFNDTVVAFFSNGVHPSTAGFVASLEGKDLREAIRYLARLIGELLSVLELGIVSDKYDSRNDDKILRNMEAAQGELSRLSFKFDTKFIRSRIGAIKANNIRNLSKDQIKLLDMIASFY